jgi:hypothetical protein
MNLTKRELIAAMMLQGILASGVGGSPENKAGCAIDFADVLLEELAATDETSEPHPPAPGPVR